MQVLHSDIDIINIEEFFVR